jgi:hypothetical protein
MYRAFLCILLILCVSACERSPANDDGEVILKDSISSCEALLKDHNLSEKARATVKSVLKKRKDNVIDREPILVRASLAQPRKRESVYLALWISDEDADTKGVGIREIVRKPDGKPIVHEETYPVFTHDSLILAYEYILPVALRRRDEGKEEESWKWFLDTPNAPATMTPDIWISIPKEGERDVEVWVYDRAGNKSEAVPVVSYLTGK